MKTLQEYAADLGGELTPEGLVCEGRVVMRWALASPKSMALDMQAAKERGQQWRIEKGLSVG